MAILTKAAPRKEAYVLPDLEVVDMTPWKYRKPVIAVTFILLAGIYCWQSRRIRNTAPGISFSSRTGYRHSDVSARL